VRRCLTFWTLICFTALGSGAVELIHNLHHISEDAREEAAAKAAGLPYHDHPDHDENTCPVHAQLHLTVLAAGVGFIPLLILLGAAIAFLSNLPVQLPMSRAPVVVDCRGPPFISSR
jgi:hypothetical protein